MSNYLLLIYWLGKAVYELYICSDVYALDPGHPASNNQLVFAYLLFVANVNDLKNSFPFIDVIFTRSYSR